MQVQRKCGAAAVHMHELLPPAFLFVATWCFAVLGTVFADTMCLCIRWYVCGCQAQ